MHLFILSSSSFLYTWSSILVYHVAAVVISTVLVWTPFITHLCLCILFSNSVCYMYMFCDGKTYMCTFWCRLSWHLGITWTAQSEVLCMVSNCKVLIWLVKHGRMHISTVVVSNKWFHFHTLWICFVNYWSRVNADLLCTVIKSFLPREHMRGRSWES